MSLDYVRTDPITGDLAMRGPKVCQAVIPTTDGDQHECGKPASHSAYEPPIFFCDDCLHECMEDASPEEQQSVKKL